MTQCATCGRAHPANEACPCTFRHRCDACGTRHLHPLDVCPSCEQPMRAVVWVADYLVALDELTVATREDALREACAHPGPMSDLGAEILARARYHLTNRLRAHLQGAQDFKNEQAALAYVKGMAVDLQQAGRALEWSAERMKAKGDAHGANTAWQARKVALAKASEVLS